MERSKYLGHFMNCIHSEYGCYSLWAAAAELWIITVGHVSETAVTCTDTQSIYTLHLLIKLALVLSLFIIHIDTAMFIKCPCKQHTDDIQKLTREAYSSGVKHTTFSEHVMLLLHFRTLARIDVGDKTWWRVVVGQDANVVLRSTNVSLS